MAYHLSIFSENKPGKLENITRVFLENNINIRGLSVASGGDFGIIKIIVNNPELAVEKLKEKRITVTKGVIIAGYIDDEIGSLHKFLSILSENKINVEDCYGIVIENNNRAIIVVEVEKYPEAESILKANGVTVLTDNEIYGIF
jgi:hypothetical protein